MLDFGLAKLIGEQNKSILGLEESTVAANATAKGVIMGTVNYMSPEQAKGETVDERTDIFSLGVVLYEMISGKRPFAGDSMAQAFANLINNEPEPLAADVPAVLRSIVAKTLRKDREDRYQTMGRVLADLKQLRGLVTQTPVTKGGPHLFRTTRQPYCLRQISATRTPQRITHRSILSGTNAADPRSGSYCCWPSAPADIGPGSARIAFGWGHRLHVQRNWRRQASISKPLTWPQRSRRVHPASLV